MPEPHAILAAILAGDRRALALLESIVGRERLVYGTNFAGWDQPERVEASAFAAALADNARRLLRKDRGPA